jgi:hypothetical protein
MKTRNPIPLALKQLLRYEDGKLFWTQRTANRVKVGDRAGSVNKVSGYRTIFFKGKHYLEHRVVWFLHHGVQPGPILDHINQARDDNRIENLRELNDSESLIHRSGWSKEGLPKNVTRRGARFEAQVKRGGKNHSLGTFDTPDEAARAAKSFSESWLSK